MLIRWLQKPEQYINNIYNQWNQTTCIRTKDWNNFISGKLWSAFDLCKRVSLCSKKFSQSTPWIFFLMVSRPVLVWIAGMCIIKLLSQIAFLIERPLSTMVAKSTFLSTLCWSMKPSFLLLLAQRWFCTNLSPFKLLVCVTNASKTLQLAKRYLVLMPIRMEFHYSISVFLYTDTLSWPPSPSEIYTCSHILNQIQISLEAADT